MFSCSLTVQTGSPRRICKAVTICQGQNRSPATGRARRDPHILQDSLISRRPIKLSHSNSLRPILPHVCQKRFQSLGGRRVPSRYPLTVLPSSILSTLDPQLVLAQTSQHFSQCYSSKSLPPQRPVSKPSGIVSSGVVSEQRALNRLSTEPGLRPEPIRKAITAYSGPFQESRLPLFLIERRQTEQSIGELEKAVSREQTQILTKWKARQKSLQRRTQQLEARLNSTKQQITLQLPILVSDRDHELVNVDSEFCEVIRRLCEAVGHALATVETAISQKERRKRALIVEKADREHTKTFSQREALRNAWWIDVESTLCASGSADKANRKLADITGNIARLHDDFDKCYYDHLALFSRYYMRNGIHDRDKELMYKVHTTLLEVLEGGEHITREAHFARLYIRVGAACSLEPGASSHDVKYATLAQSIGKLQDSGKAVSRHVGSWNQSFWRRWSSDSRLQDSSRPSRLTDLCELINGKTDEIRLTMQEFTYGVLSSDYASEEIRMRRAQAAALIPFQNHTIGLNQLLRHILDVDDIWDWKGNPSPLKKVHGELAYYKKEIMYMVNQFNVAHWKSNKHHLSSRTIFLKPQNQSDSRLSPIDFAVPPGYPKRSHWDYNYYRGPQGKVVQVFYGRDVASMESALMQLQHNGVVSLDVRWAPADPSIVPDWFGRDVSVVTVSSQSQIVVCHLALSRMYRHKLNIPDSLRQLLEDPRVIKVGMDMDELQRRCTNYLGITMVGTCDIGSLDTHVQSILSAGAQYPQSTDLERVVKKYFNLDLTSTLRSKTAWLHGVSMHDLQCVSAGAYACLRLFFHLTKSLLDLKSERSIPLNGCSDETVQDLDLLFPAVAKDVDKVSWDNLEGHVGKEADDTGSPSAQTFYEELGPVMISRGSSGWEDLARNWARELSQLTLNELRRNGRQILSSLMPSLLLYHLWQTLECDCDDIEALLPQPHANLPALILEVIDQLSLPHHIEKKYAALQKMAIIQLNTKEKLVTVGDQLRHSWIADLTPAALSIQISGLMPLIRAKTKAEEWISNVAKTDQVHASRKPYQGLLPYAMWDVGCASPEDISRLLLQSKSSVAASILDGVRRLNTREKFSKSALGMVIQMTVNPSYWLKGLDFTSKGAETMDAQLENSKVGNVTTSNKQLAHPSNSSPVVRSPTVQTRIRVLKITEPLRSMRKNAHSRHDSSRKMLGLRKKEFTCVGLIRKMSGSKKRDSTRVGLIQKIPGLPPRKVDMGAPLSVSAEDRPQLQRVPKKQGTPLDPTQSASTSPSTKDQSIYSVEAPVKNDTADGLVIVRFSKSWPDIGDARGFRRLSMDVPTGSDVESDAKQFLKPRPAEPTSTSIKKQTPKVAQKFTSSSAPKKKKPKVHTTGVTSIANYMVKKQAPEPVQERKSSGAPKTKPQKSKPAEATSTTNKPVKEQSPKPMEEPTSFGAPVKKKHRSPSDIRHRRARGK